ncbi:hypothetical protein GCM10023349_00420 [Nocardioides conyzicola]|uniref:Uncharacterized protein n=1 Tax=Nocardioides conyzicola TaxID=1651781 RepID=A0ABP8WIR2_9ACTN
MREVLSHRCAGEPRRDPKGTAESLPAYGELEALGSGVQVRSPTGCGGCRIGYDDRLAVCIRAGGHPQQLALGGPLPTSHTGPDRAREGRGIRACKRAVFTRHCCLA